MFFFFFKQKTAYEMRISDWSSDVCSSDLAVAAPDHSAGAAGRNPGPSWAERRERFARRLGRWLRKNAMSFYVAMFFLVLGMLMPAPDSDERRLGKEFGCTCRSRLSTSHYKNIDQ